MTGLQLDFVAHIFRWNDLLELVECELGLALPHVVPEDRLQPLDILPGESPVLSTEQSLSLESSLGLQSHILLVRLMMKAMNSSRV